MDVLEEHRRKAEAVRAAATGTSGVTESALRAEVMARAADGSEIAAPFEELARQIGQAATGVTDGQVEAVRAKLGSDKAAFEVVMAASIGAGLERWDTAMRAIQEAHHAAS